MNFEVSTTEEAWEFLINEVYNANKGKFRIYTNKKGIRLFLRFYNENFTGQVWKYYTGLGYKYHKNLRRIDEKMYCDTLTDVNLISVLNKHISAMPGNILFDDEYIKKIGTDVSNEMTPEELIYLDCEERRQLSMYEERLIQLKQIYKWD